MYLVVVGHVFSLGSLFWVGVLRAALHDLCAAFSGLFRSDWFTWSACHGSVGEGPIPQIQQVVAFARTCAARLR